MRERKVINNFFPFFFFYQRDDQFPLAPYNGLVKFKNLSPFNKKLLKIQNHRDYRRKKYNSKKLLATFYPRRKYVVLLDNLQYYLRKGLKLVKIRRAVKFTQKDFLKDFITKITKLRSEAKTEFELRLFKLFANSTFGKFIGNNIFFSSFFRNQKIINEFYNFFQKTLEITSALFCATMKKALEKRA